MINGIQGVEAREVKSEKLSGTLLEKSLLEEEFHWPWKQGIPPHSVDHRNTQEKVLVIRSRNSQTA